MHSNDISHTTPKPIYFFNRSPLKCDLNYEPRTYKELQPTSRHFIPLANAQAWQNIRKQTVHFYCA